MKLAPQAIYKVFPRESYRIEVYVEPASPHAKTSEPQIYVTKVHHGGEIGERSIGLTMNDVREMVEVFKELLQDGTSDRLPDDLSTR